MIHKKMAPFGNNVYRLVLISCLLATQVSCRTYPAQAQTQTYAPTPTTPPTPIHSPTAAYNPLDILLLHQRILSALSNSISSLLATPFVNQPNQNWPAAYGPSNGAALFGSANTNGFQPGNELATLYQPAYPVNGFGFPQRSYQQTALPVASYPFDVQPIKPVYEPFHTTFYQQPPRFTPFGGANPPRSTSPFVVSTIGHLPSQSMAPAFPAIGPNHFIDTNEQNFHLIPSQDVPIDGDMSEKTQNPASNGPGQPSPKAKPIDTGLNARSKFVYENADRRESTYRQISTNIRPSSANA